MSNDAYSEQFTPAYNVDSDNLPYKASVPDECDIVSHLETGFRTAVMHKCVTGVTGRLMEAWHAARLQYTCEFEERLREKKSATVFLGIFAAQRASGLAHFNDLMAQVNQRPWTLEATPRPEIYKEIKEEVISKVLAKLMAQGAATPALSDAKGFISEEAAITARMIADKAAKIAEAHAGFIEDQMIEGSWPRTFEEFRGDLMTYPNAFILAPEAQYKSVPAWKGAKYVAEDKLVYETRTISPFNVFPMPDCTTTQDGEGVYIVEEVSAAALYGMKDDRLSFTENIEELLENNQNGWWAGGLMGDVQSENYGIYAQSRSYMGSSEAARTYSVIRFFGLLRTEVAIAAGIYKPRAKYPPTISVEIWFCAGEILRAAVIEHPLLRDKRPIYTASFREMPRSFWGVGLHDVLRDVEKMANKAMRELVSHSSVSLGFFGELDVGRAGKNNTNNDLLVNQIMRVEPDYTRGGHSALKIQTIESKIPHIISLIDKYSALAEDLTGIRRFMSGSADLSSAARTGGIVNSLMRNSSKLIILTQSFVNRRVIVPLVEHYYTLNMIYSKRKGIKGDLKVVVRGSDGLQKKELFNEQMEKMLQYGASWAQNGYIDKRDFQELVVKWFDSNGADLEFTPRPSETDMFTPQAKPVGDGGMEQIDARSNPQQLG